MSAPRRVPMRPTGKAKLVAFLKELREIQRPETVEAIEVALGHGDLSENAEYHSAKEKLAIINAQINATEDALSRAQVIDPASLDLDRIAFGAKVELLDLDKDKEHQYSIVGSEEADASMGLISYDSPLARALIGKEEGDVVVFQAPRGRRRFEVVGIEYE